MKKYVCFAYDNYYPSGGTNDLIGSFESLEATRAAFLKEGYELGEIIDRDTWESLETLDRYRMLNPPQERTT